MSQSQSCVLLTGGAGFIGSTLVRQCLAHESSRVVNLDKLTYAGLWESLADVLDDPRHVLIEGDVADAGLVRSVLDEHQPNLILHLAAETHVDRSIDAPPRFAMTNVVGSCTLLDQAVRYWQGLDANRQASFRFLLVSTDEVFGSAAAGEQFTEASPPRPNSPYAASKASAELLARAFEHTYGLPIVTLNPTNNYGPRQSPEKLIPKMILAASRRQPLPLYGDGLHERDWLHVDDCCRAIRAIGAGGAPGRRYLAGAGQCTPNLRIVEQICDLVDARLADRGGRRALIGRVADRPGHDRRYAVDSSKLRSELDWQPQVALADGLRETVDWYLDHPDWVASAEAALQSK